ncbi:MAG: asparagine synthase (glutamine-hydrolyzing) [Alphaproteobacteria bacterium]|nr:asparagine synthase (glutamine-hydrolyzing) [Alphaproteobacteria bacterium]
MCGIAGIMTASGAPPDRQAISAMQRALVHRGPDGEGSHFREGVGMAQTRLAIIDLETGNQPFTLADGTALIANAEIYNYIELKAEMRDVAFASASDCEVPLHLYARDGDRFAERLRGMYAIAIHDPGARRLVLARDPFGIKQLYYAEGDFGFAFASEPQALIAAGLVKPRLRADKGAELLQLQFTTGPATMFEGIWRVLPGETLVVESGRIARRLRRAALPEGGEEVLGEAEALARLDAALTDSVMVHQRSDVPYGMFLSGGVDSTAVLALMARLNDRPVKAYTVGFSDTRAADERAHARAVAAALGAKHVEVDFTEQDFWRALPGIARAVDDPVADYAELPTWKLAEVARRDDIKVILCGEGGDELFAGYGRYRAMTRPWWRYRRAMRSHGAVEGLGLLREENREWRAGIAAAESAAALPGRSRLQIAQAIDCADWLAHDLLIKLDRCLMAHGVEGRTPLLDPAVAEAAYRLPARLKLRGRTGKYLLRKWLSDTAPVSQPFSRKRGFTVPVGEWIVRRGAAIGPLVARQAGIQALCRPGAVESVFRARGRRAGFAAWVLLFYALWHRCHIEGRALAGDAFDALADR